MTLEMFGCESHTPKRVLNTIQSSLRAIQPTAGTRDRQTAIFLSSCKGPISLQPFFLLGRPSTIESLYIGRDRHVLIGRVLVRMLCKIELGSKRQGYIGVSHIKIPLGAVTNLPS